MGTQEAGEVWKRGMSRKLFLKSWVWKPSRHGFAEVSDDAQELFLLTEQNWGFFFHLSKKKGGHICWERISGGQEFP